MTVIKDTRPYTQRKVVFESKRLVVLRDKARIHGRFVEKIWIRRPRVSAMLVLRDPRRLVLVRQYRYGVNKTLWELPAGTVDDGESPRACAIRECQEETGWIPGKTQAFGSFFGAPAGSQEETFFFIQSNLKKGEQNLDPDEHLTVGEFGVARLRRMLASGEICDAKSIIGLYKYFEKIGLLKK